MTKPDGTIPEAVNDDASAASWGTWEELLLAFAVNRHGIGAWDSIATELQNRDPGHAGRLTAENCRLKYLNLRSRFVNRKDDEEGSVKLNDEDSLTLLDELRKLRMVELRREVQRYDLNIESLELKVKRMEEEKEKEKDKEKEIKIEIEKEKKTVSDLDPEIKIEEIEKNLNSVNESNSTAAEKLKTGGGAEEETKPDEPIIEVKSEPDVKSVEEDSFNGSSNSIEKEPVQVEPVSDSAESKGKEPVQENSDVQSSASRSIKEDDDGSDKVRHGSTSGGEREHVDESHTVKEISNESGPFMEFLQVIRSHQFGSIFERPLSQENPKLGDLILQHIDLETINSRLKKGWYSVSARSKFFRDLLLLVSNAHVFFGENSMEYKAATQIQELISKEMPLPHKSTKSDSSSGKQISLQSLSNNKKEEEAEPSNALLLKPRLSGPLIVCRKRSSIAAKGSDKKKEKTAEEPQSSNAEELKITKKRTSDRFSSVSDNSKKNSKNQTNNSKNSAVDSKAENKKNQSTIDSKKRGAANFLNRMKQGSSSNNGVLVDALKNTPLTSESAKKNEIIKRGVKKEHVTKKSSETKHAKEKDSGSKKNIGRPPKRAAPPPPPPQVAGKRSREKSEADSGGSKKPKKRSRKL